MTTLIHRPSFIDDAARVGLVLCVLMFLGLVSYYAHEDFARRRAFEQEQQLILDKAQAIAKKEYEKAARELGVK